MDTSFDNDWDLTSSQIRAVVKLRKLYSNYPDALGTKEVMKMLGVGRATVLNLKNCGMLRHYNLGNRLLFPKEWVIEYLEEFAPYEEVEVGGKEYLLVHAGLGNFAPDRDPDDYLLSELTLSEPDYERIYFPDKTLVTGHKPTVEINPSYKGKIFRLNGHIALDCGAEYGLPLGCIRLDDGKEFYVE